MYIDKNMYDNLFNSMMDIKGKSKDNIMARMDLKEYCKCIELKLMEVDNGRIHKPKAKFSFTIKQKYTICK